MLTFDAAFSFFGLHFWQRVMKPPECAVTFGGQVEGRGEEPAVAAGVGVDIIESESESENPVALQKQNQPPTVKFSQAMIPHNMLV